MRKQAIEDKQLAITEKNMERFVGQTADVLIEEYFSEEAQNGSAAGNAEDVFYDENGQANTVNKENLWLGRLYSQAPEIDGAAVILTDKNLRAGTFAKCKITARCGFDLEVRI